MLLISILLIPLIICLIGHIKGRVTIFYNYKDLILTFLVAFLPFSYFYISFFIINHPILKIFFLITEIILLCILYRITYISNNRSIFMTLCIMYTKLIMSFIFVFYILQIIVSSKRQKQNFGSQLSAFLVSVVIAPIITKYVLYTDYKNIGKYKNGF